MGHFHLRESWQHELLVFVRKMSTRGRPKGQTSSQPWTLPSPRVMATRTSCFCLAKCLLAAGPKVDKLRVNRGTLPSPRVMATRTSCFCLAKCLLAAGPKVDKLRVNRGTLPSPASHGNTNFLFLSRKMSTRGRPQSRQTSSQPWDTSISASHGNTNFLFFLQMSTRGRPQSRQTSSQVGHFHLRESWQHELLILSRKMSTLMTTADPWHRSWNCRFLFRLSSRGNHPWVSSTSWSGRIL